MHTGVRVLFLADSHLGFDLPARTRVSRRRRGHDFLANYAAALAPALAGQADLVIHGGDVFDRPGVPASLAYQAFEPLVRVAAHGVPVFIVPGNHERSRMPHVRLAAHPLLHVFDRPRTFSVRAGGVAVALSGFPFERSAVRDRFPELLEATGWRREGAQVRLLCMHQCVEGATVGPADFTFRHGADVVQGAEIPGAFSAVLSGHIHRHQVLTADLQRRPLQAPVFYPGSIERTSFAEMSEPKGFMLLQLGSAAGPGSLRWDFRRLPARPMVEKHIATRPGSPGTLERTLRFAIADAPRDAVLRIRVTGDLSEADLRVIAARSLRGLAPDTMNVEVRSDSWPVPGRTSPVAGPAPRAPGKGAAHRRRGLAADESLPIWAGIDPV